MPERSRELTQFYADIIIGATEGGTTYWAYSAGYTHPEDAPEDTRVYYVDMELYDEFPSNAKPDPEKHEEEGNPWNLVTVDKVAHAFTIINGPKEKIGLNDSLRARYARIYREKDGGEIDAGDADNIVQLAMFGEVVYG